MRYNVTSLKPSTQKCLFTLVLIFVKQIRFQRHINPTWRKRGLLAHDAFTKGFMTNLSFTYKPYARSRLIIYPFLLTNKLQLTHYWRVSHHSLIHAFPSLALVGKMLLKWLTAWFRYRMEIFCLCNARPQNYWIRYIYTHAISQHSFLRLHDPTWSLS